MIFKRTFSYFSIPAVYYLLDCYMNFSIFCLNFIAQLLISDLLSSHNPHFLHRSWTKNNHRMVFVNDNNRNLQLVGLVILTGVDSPSSLFITAKFPQTRWFVFSAIDIYNNLVCGLFTNHVLEYYSIVIQCIFFLTQIQRLFSKFQFISLPIYD